MGDKKSEKAPIRNSKLLVLALFLILIGMAFQHFVIEPEISDFTSLNSELEKMDALNSDLNDKWVECVDEKNFINNELSSCLGR